ncbi:peroxidase-related enzyme [Rhodococcus sp. D2-41]|uniref:peroxidase-related enzyme n=1 Tax=Speluncibacter jeojiensis TaxID=2710754 RepID=UPI00241043CF|nr:peroxidase-related enzyme [Rhodococcus sp. D2-41]MDG3011176.1 peroxidase-related enzyme [Rhodococcus sp. D2-41]
MARVAWFFPTPSDDDIPEGLRSLFAKAQQAVGFLPNVFRGYAYRPERFSSWFRHFSALQEPTPNLDTADREMIGVVVSAINRCPYCVISHGHALRAALGDQFTADAIAVNWRHADLDDRRRAICAYAEKLTRAPHTVGEDDLRALAAVGLSTEEVWDVVELVAMYAFTNRLALATGQMPNEQYHYVDR